MTAKFALETSSDYLTSRAGLILIGQLLDDTKINKRLNFTTVGNTKVPMISHADNVRAYLGLLCQGKSDFDQIEPFRHDRFFSKALGIRKLTSSPTLRQRLDQAAPSGEWQKIVLEESSDLLKRVHAPLTPVQLTAMDGKELAYLPLDLDVSPFENTGGLITAIRKRRNGCKATWNRFKTMILAYVWTFEE